VWYCKECNTVKLARLQDLPIDPLVDKPVGKCDKCGCKEFIPEKDVLDTWATSSLSPKLAIELAPKNVRDKLYPMNLRPNAHDIITFWLFNTVVKSYLHDKKTPWSNIMVSGHVQDPNGRKMSKSKGNVIAPRDIIEKYSADALRFFSTEVTLGDDYPFKEQGMIRATKFLVKLWNSGKFIEMQEIKGKEEREFFSDKWILNGLNEVIKKATKYLDDYNYIKAKNEVVNFFFQEFADYYIEMIKYRIYGEDVASKNSAVMTLKKVYLSVLKMVGIFTPFIAEELHNELFDSKISIHNTEWPVAEKYSKTIFDKGELLKNIISQGRQYKTNNGISLGSELEHMKVVGPKYISEFSEDIKGTLKIINLEIVQAEELIISF